jgi:hypothetical protein
VPAGAEPAAAACVLLVWLGSSSESGGAKSSCTLKLLLGFKQPTRGVTCSPHHHSRMLCTFSPLSTVRMSQTIMCSRVSQL